MWLKNPRDHFEPLSLIDFGATYDDRLSLMTSYFGSKNTWRWSTHLLVPDDREDDEAVAEDGDGADDDVGAEDEVMQRRRDRSVVLVLPQQVTNVWKIMQENFFLPKLADEGWTLKKKKTNQGCNGRCLISSKWKNVITSQVRTFWASFVAPKLILLFNARGSSAQPS